MKINLWCRGPEDIPMLVELLGASEEELLKDYNAAEDEGKICVFKTEVSEEQYRRIQQWKNEH